MCLVMGSLQLGVGAEHVVVSLIAWNVCVRARERVLGLALGFSGRTSDNAMFGGLQFRGSRICHSGSIVCCRLTLWQNHLCGLFE